MVAQVFQLLSLLLSPQSTPAGESIQSTGLIPFFTQLGAFGTAAAILWLWKSSESREKERLLNVLEAQTNLLSDIKRGVESNETALLSLNRTVEINTQALTRLTEVMGKMPTEAELVRMRDTLAEVNRRRNTGG